MKKIIIIISLCLPLLVTSQVASSQQSDDVLEQELAAQHWISDLYEMGIEMTEDSVKISEEFQKLMIDKDYRDILYPDTYTWTSALQLLQKDELKKAFWHMINLYPESEASKELVVKSILVYDQLLKMDEVLVATFYTYSFVDPEVGIIVDGQPEITRPDLLEAKLRTVKEIVNYVLAYREKEG